MMVVNMLWNVSFPRICSVFTYIVGAGKVCVLPKTKYRGKSDRTLVLLLIEVDQEDQGESVISQ